MTPIYQPKGAAKEYGDYALNIYTGCPHRCFYCFAPQVLHRDRMQFHGVVEPRKNIVEETRKQLEREDFRGKTIHLCFTCDPYPTGYDTTPTREIIQLLKAHGCHVQILTKGDGSRDFELLDGEDWYGITISGDALDTTNAEPGAVKPTKRMALLGDAKLCGINTWVSFEPVVNDVAVLECIRKFHGYFDRVKIGKLNYHPSTIHWADFGQKAESLCKELGLDYYIKDSLREKMEQQV